MFHFPSELEKGVQKMRTLFSLIVVALLLVMPVAVFAHTVDNPFTTDLIADGGDNPTVVGQVKVWNDSEYLYVKYVVDAPYWHLTDTHLAVATSLGGIPQKNGNPPPGQFPYNETMTDPDYYHDLEGY